MEQKKQDRQFYRVWMGEKERIASFHEVAGYRQERFEDHDEFILFLRRLQEQGFRFQ